MKKTLIIASLLTFFGLGIKAQSYNNLWIPDTLSGTNFNLTIKDTFAQLTPGNQTITAGINGKFWGPTLFFNKGDTVVGDEGGKLVADYRAIDVPPLHTNCRCRILPETIEI